MAHDFWATIGGDRGAEWERVLGTRRLPITSPLSQVANLPGKPGAQIHKLAIDVLEPGQLDKIVRHLSGKFGLTEAQAEQEVKAAGIPILAEDLSVEIINPQRWL